MLLWEGCCRLPGAVSTSVSDTDVRSQKAYEPQLSVVAADTKQTFDLKQQVLDKRISHVRLLSKTLEESWAFFQTRALNLSE